MQADCRGIGPIRISDSARLALMHASRVGACTIAWRSSSRRSGARGNRYDVGVHVTPSPPGRRTAQSCPETERSSDPFSALIRHSMACPLIEMSFCLNGSSPPATRMPVATMSTPVIISVTGVRPARGCSPEQVEILLHPSGTRRSRARVSGVLDQSGRGLADIITLLRADSRPGASSMS